MNNKPTTYKVRFPFSSPLPKVTLIKYNNQVICSGPIGKFYINSNLISLYTYMQYQYDTYKHVKQVILLFENKNEMNYLF